MNGGSLWLVLYSSKGCTQEESFRERCQTIMNLSRPSQSNIAFTDDNIAAVDEMIRAKRRVRNLPVESSVKKFVDL